MSNYFRLCLFKAYILSLWNVLHIHSKFWAYFNARRIKTFLSFFFACVIFFFLAGHRGIALGHSPFSLHPPTTNIWCKSATPNPNCLQLTQKAIKKKNCFFVPVGKRDSQMCGLLILLFSDLWVEEELQLRKEVSKLC